MTIRNLRNSKNPIRKNNTPADPSSSYHQNWNQSDESTWHSENSSNTNDGIVSTLCQYFISKNALNKQQQQFYKETKNKQILQTAGR